MALLLSAKLWAGYGVVQTLDGRKYEGEVRLESGAVVVSATNQPAARIEMTELSLLRFQAPPAPTNASNLVQGWRGTYFSQPNLTGNRELRIDPAVNFDWHDQAPVTGFAPGSFSVRWEGQITPPASGQFTFYIQADGGVRLWVQDQLLIDHWQPSTLIEWSGSANLESGKSCALKLEYFSSGGGALARLLWSGPSISRGLVQAQCLDLPRAQAPAPAPAPPRPKLAAGVLLTSGSNIARRISSADDTSVRLFESTNEMVVSAVKVAQLIFQPVSSNLAERIPAGRVGVLLSNKEFIEGEFKSFVEGQITISSVLFGLRTYDPGQVITVVLRGLRPGPVQYELRTRDDSLLLASAVRIEKDLLSLQEPILASVKIPSSELVELKKRPQ